MAKRAVVAQGLRYEGPILRCRGDSGAGGRVGYWLVLCWCWRVHRRRMTGTEQSAQRAIRAQHKQMRQGSFTVRTPTNSKW